MAVSRRTFLVRAAQCALLLAVPPGLVACGGGLTRDDTTKDEGYARLSSAIGPERAEILWYASFAPSSHNTQPWMVTIESENRWVVGSSRERWLPEVDPQNRETLLSIGAFVENLVTAAATFGFRIAVEPVARTPFDTELVRLELQNAVRREYPLERLLERRTLRTGFKSDDIDAEDFSFIVGGSDGFYYYPPSSVQAAWLDNASIEAVRHQTTRKNVQEELAAWIRWSDADARKYRNGLTPESMDITGLAGWYVRNFYGTGDVLSKDFRKASVERARKQVAESGGWIVVTSRDDSPLALLDTGRRFERMFLKAKDRKIAVHPMSQVLEESPWAEKAAASLMLSGKPQLLLRVGYMRDYPGPVSLRMPVAETTTLGYGRD